MSSVPQPSGIRARPSSGCSSKSRRSSIRYTTTATHHPPPTPPLAPRTPLTLHPAPFSPLTPHPPAPSQDVFPFYIGDDVTDEDAFRIMGDLGGIGIIVSDTAVEDGTAASYALHNPLQVVHFLDHFANVVSESQCERDQRDQRDQRDHQRDHPFEFASA
jgi:hypothetical protein